MLPLNVEEVLSQQDVTNELENSSACIFFEVFKVVLVEAGRISGDEHWHSSWPNGQLDHDGQISSSSMTLLEDLGMTDGIPPADKLKGLY